MMTRHGYISQLVIQARKAMLEFVLQNHADSSLPQRDCFLSELQTACTTYISEGMVVMRHPSARW